MPGAWLPSLPPGFLRRWLLAAVLAGCCTAIFHTRVYTDFERVRFRVVASAQEAQAGTVVAALPDLQRLAGQPAALVLRLRNTADAAPAVVRVTAGSRVLGLARAPAGREVRVDLSVPDGAVLAAADQVEFTAAISDWALTYFEAANVHGHSSGLFSFVITPAAARPPQRPAAPASMALFGLLLGLYGVLWRRIEHRWGRVAHAAAAVLVASFLAAVLVAPWVSAFAVLLAAPTFFLCLAALCYPALAVVARELVVRAPRWLWSRRFRLAYAAAIVFFLVSMARWYDPETGLTTLIRFGERFEHDVLPAVGAVPRHVHEGSYGYDGQFYAQLAVDPLLRDPALGDALDTPAFRARRILFSWTAWAAGLGRPDWIVHAYVLQHLVAWLLLAWVLCRWFPPTSLRHFGVWFACLFSQGLIFSVLFAVPDGPGLLLLALGVAAMEAGRTRLAAVVIGSACLAKSINVLWGAVVVGPDDVQRRDWRGVLLRGALVAGPAAAWTLFVLVGRPEFGGLAEMAGGGSSRNFGLPLSGYAAKWAVTVAELRAEGWDSLPPRFNLLALIALTTQAAVLLAVRDWRDPWWRAGIGSVLLMVFLGPAVWEGHPMAATRVLLPMTVAFNVVLLRTAWFWPLWVLGNVSALYAFDALHP